MASIACPNCGFDSPGEFKYCGQCGTQLSIESFDALDVGSNSAQPRVERRQLTVLFCDLVGSTELSQRLDPEDLRRVIRAYQQCCAPIIERYGGFVSRFLGDGILAFFGYPSAREDDAERAVHAGLGIIGAMKALDWTVQSGVRLDIAVRVGISTGVVVAGDLIGKDAAAEEAVVGETPNLAARLQSLAEPNTVLIPGRTQRLVSGRFRFTALGAHELKGFMKPVDVWRVDSSDAVHTRFGSTSASRVIPMVNRHHEMKLLFDRWELSKSGKSQIILLTGEAGIGKSRIAQSMREHLEGEPHYFLQYQCSPLHANTAFHPIITQIERAARIARDEGEELKREKLRRLFRDSGPHRQRAVSAIATLLSIANEPDDEFEELSAKAKKLGIIETLLDKIVSLSNSRPLLAIVEDAHWSDPSSRELFHRFSHELLDKRILMLLTCRTESTFLGDEFSNAEAVQVSRLETEYSRDLVSLVASGSDLQRDLVRRIVDKADGIPLFAEELTKTLLVRAKQSDHDDERQDAVHDAEIPDTLHDLLMARLDQLGPGKRIAQIASVIGRQFSLELILRIAKVDESDIRNGFENLVDSGLVVVDGTHPHASHSFKHALIRDTAYGSLLRDDRRELHGRTAATLEASGSLVAPELLARHYTEAGLNVQAIDYWLSAGKSASQRSAYREAVSHFQNGLRMLRVQPISEERDRMRLEYLVNLGPALIAIRGSAAADTMEAYREAVALVETLPESENHFTALWGWWRISGNFRTDAERATKLEQLAERLGDDGLKLQAHHCQWATRFHLGDHEACMKHVHAGLKLYQGRDYRSHAARYGGHDPRVCALGEAAQSLWLTGYPSRASHQMSEARLWAEQLKQFGSLVHVMDMNLLLLRYRCEPEAAANQATELMLFARDKEFPEYIAKAEAFGGWAMAKCGQEAEGLRKLKDSIALYDTIGTDEDPPVWLEMLADCYFQLGEYQLGLEAIERAFSHTEQSGLSFWDAELHRRRGELYWHAGSRFRNEARHCLEKAVRISIEQGARSLQCRAEISLAKCLENAREEAEVRHRLSQLVDELDDARGTPDHTAAISLLASGVGC